MNSRKSQPRNPGPLRRLWAQEASGKALRSSLDRQRLAAACPERLSAARVDQIAPGLRERALADLGEPWPAARPSDYARYFRDGDRSAYESNIRARHTRLSRAVVMSLAAESSADRDRWLDEVADGAILFCEQSSWSWAAHDDVWTRQRHTLPDVDSPFLDLGAGEVAAQLAWLDLAIGPVLETRYPGIENRIRLEVARRVFDPFLQRSDWHWLGLHGDVHNWNPWIHGNLIVAACALAVDSAVRARIVARSIEGLDRFLASLPLDGAIDEGYAYWWNGAGRALEALEVLELATGSVLDPRPLAFLPALVRFPVDMHIAGDWYVNVADAPGRVMTALPWRTLAHWARVAGDEAAVAEASRQAGRNRADTEDVGLGRLLLALADLEWPPAGISGPAAPRRSVWLGSVQLLVARAGEEAAAVVVAAKGGHNGEHHNHKDLGSFTVAVGGEPVLVDAGQPTYTSTTFGPDRYSIRAMQSAWHSTPAPWGLEQSLGPEARTTAEYRDDEAGTQVTFDLSRAYLMPVGSRWFRTVRLARAEHSVVVEEAWRLRRPKSAPWDGVLLHYLVRGDVVVSGPSSVVVGPPSDRRRQVALRWEGPALDFTLQAWPLDDPLLRCVWGDHLTRLTVTIPAAGIAGPARALEGRVRLSVSSVR